MSITREEFIRRVAADLFWNDMARKPEDRTPLDRDEANSLLISCLVNRGIQFERAMGLVNEMKRRTGCDDTIKMFTELTTEMVEWHMFADYAAVDNEGKPLPSLHRYRYMAEYCCLASRKIERDYSGDIRRVWRDEPTGSELMRRVCEFKGVGAKCGGLFVRLVVLSHGVRLWDTYAGMDVSPDVHVARCMKRLGLVPEDATPQDVVNRARELSPYAPVEWEGLWLHAVEGPCSADARCDSCGLLRVCPSRRL